MRVSGVEPEDWSTAGLFTLPPPHPLPHVGWGSGGFARGVLGPPGGPWAVPSPKEGHGGQLRVLAGSEARTAASLDSRSLRSATDFSGPSGSA